MRWWPRLASVLFAVNLLIVLLPLGGIGVLRLYESELIRSTESELNVQGALVASMFRAELLKYLSTNRGKSPAEAGDLSYGTHIPPDKVPAEEPQEPWLPVEPSLDLARDRILPPAPRSFQPDRSADPSALAAAQGLTPILRNAVRKTLSGIRVMDYQGIVVASTLNDVGKSLVNHEEVRRALQGEHMSVLRRRMGDSPAPPLESISRGSRVRVFVAMPVVEANRVLGAILLTRTPLDLSKATYRTRFYLLGGFVVILLVMGGVTLLTALLVTRPVQALIRQAQQVVRGEKGAAAVALKHPGTKEVAMLSHALTEMSETLEKRGEYIRTFASHVSHEFKTPLTSLRGTVELLKDHFEDMSPQERTRFLDILEQDADRLTRLVTKLLDLARAEVVRPGTERAQVAEACNRIARRFGSDGLHVTLDLPAALPLVVMGPEVLESILSNLVDNARQHGRPDVHVHLAAKPVKHQGGDGVEVTIEDDGQGISPAVAEKIFTPFFTTARDSGSTGLGLSIVQALLVAHHGSITLEATASGTRFRIVLPAKARKSGES
jgi:signal transduction histidine kinase